MFPTRCIVLLLSFFYTSLLFAQPTVYEVKEIARLTDKADWHLNQLQFKESLFFSREALKQAIIIKDNYLIATAYNTIAGNYDELSENEKAILYYKKALLYAYKANDDVLKGRLNNNLGNVYFFEKKEFNKGINYYKKAIDYSEKTADTSRIVLTNLNIVWAYFDIGEFEKGIPHFNFINKHYAKHNDSSTVVILKMLNGMYNSHIGQLEKANTDFLEAIAIAQKNNENLDLSYTYEQYYKFLRKREDFKKAYTYLLLYDETKDRIYSVDKLIKANSEGVNLELDEYKRAIEKIGIEKEVQNLSLKKSKIIVILFIVFILVLLLFLFTFYRNNNYRKQLNAELMSANKELKKAKEIAEKASLLKSQFVSTISHELRTPLYGVVGITNMILEEHKELANSPHLTSLKFSAKYLLSLVNDILQINKIEEKRVVLENLTFNVSDEIYTIQNSLQFIANRNKNKIKTKIDSKIPEFLIGDKLRLSQIFMNLVSNALKFTTNGEVKITANLVKVAGNLNYIQFIIKDNGIGIAKEDQSKIFDKFVQIERKEDDYQGTGLGLSIVQQLIELFGSEIHLQSKEGEGTTFTFTIAFEHDSEKSEEIIKTIEVDLSSGQIFKVLVVEDNKINQMVTKKIIENHNFKCRVVEDGLTAIKLLQKETFDVILMDINMPIINGFETTRRIRNLGITTPVIALTAFDKDEISEEAISSGMNDIIVKPFEPVKLFQVISNHIHKKNAD